MSWIDALDQYGHNFIVDELAWHLYEGREPTSIVKRTSPEPGVMFEFVNLDDAFHHIPAPALNASWEEAIEIVREFPQLGSLVFRDT